MQGILKMGVSGDSVVKNLPANAGDTGDVGSNPGINPRYLALRADSLLSEPPGKCSLSKIKHNSEADDTDKEHSM